jgi:uncharacterized Zn finger protein
VTPGAGDTSAWWPPAPPRRPGTGARRAAGRRPFGTTWWGAAWVDAIEHRASLDPNRLPRGRSYARSGQVDHIEVEPGLIRSLVQGSRPEPYVVRIRVRTFSGTQWDDVLDALAAQAGHTAALLEGELLPDIAEDMRRAGLEILPGPGEVQPRCSCPDWADPCKHAAAACYLMADELDRDPFVLFLLRGRDRAVLMAGLRARRARRGPDAPQVAKEDDVDEEDTGVIASAAWGRNPGPLPRVPSPPIRPGRPTVLAVDPPPGSPVPAEALRALAADAVARAWSLAVGTLRGPLELTFEQDLARRAATLLVGPDGDAGPDTRGTVSVVGADAWASGSHFADLARRAGLPSRELLRRALAWRYGGAGALSALLEPWDPTPDQLASGRAAAGAGAGVRRNRVTLGERQLRLGLDGRWYPFRKTRTGWDPDGPAGRETSDEAPDQTAAPAGPT